MWPEQYEVLQWYRSVFESFLAMDDDNPAIDEDVISAMIADTLYFEGRELLPLIRKLYDRGFVYDGICGDYASIESGMGKYSPDQRKQRVGRNIFERYEEAITTWHYYRMKYDEEYRKEYPQAELESPASFSSSQLHNSERQGAFERKGKKVGRNDPCPCGSGKKYKKCCGRKG